MTARHFVYDTPHLFQEFFPLRLPAIHFERTFGQGLLLHRRDPLKKCVILDKG